MSHFAADLMFPFLQLAVFESDESRWQAVQRRDAEADGSFVYAVKTTKIFCRPTCKARLARRANVRFYVTAEEAQQDGFRACKRCKPEVLGLMPEEAAVQKIRAFFQDQQRVLVDGNAEHGAREVRMSLSQMARRTGLSKWHFHRVFKKCVGMTPVEYVKMRRDGALAAAVNEGVEESRSTLSWSEPFDFSDFDFAGFDGGLVAFEGTNIEDSSASQSECGPLSLDDILVWPEDIATNYR